MVIVQAGFLPASEIWTTQGSGGWPPPGCTRVVVTATYEGR